MPKSYADIIAAINAGIVKLRAAQPEALDGYSAMARGALKPGALPQLTKELIALAIGVAGHCEGCIGFHAKALARLGANREQIMETLAVAVYMGGGPSLMYAAEAVHAFEEFAAQPAAPRPAAAAAPGG
ncbi:MAG TPA: carboxymuconolactone decarboxylase family protein [Burkholderiales bacterium]|nr:carboxymuconolactone decarboxylase family protein [Burkholderiales bacterium]